MNRSGQAEGPGSISSPVRRTVCNPKEIESGEPRVVHTCLVTGGAGFLGINLIRYLIARGVQVVSLDMAPFEYPERDSVNVIDGDIRDMSSVRAAMEGVDTVVHAAAALPLYSAEEIYSTDVVSATFWRRRMSRVSTDSSTFRQPRCTASRITIR